MYSVFSEGCFGMRFEECALEPQLEGGIEGVVDREAVEGLNVITFLNVIKS